VIVEIEAIPRRAARTIEASGGMSGKDRYFYVSEEKAGKS
jgi:hypothetical protein